MNKLNSYRPFVISLFIFFLSVQWGGCTRSYRIDEDKFVKVYTDIIIAQDTANADNKQLDSIKGKIFGRYGITKAQYDSTLSFYNSNPEKWEKFFDKTIKYVEDLRDRSNKKSK